jgi:hypothetical protein
MDPEDLREVISAYQKCVAETVQRSLPRPRLRSQTTMSMLARPTVLPVAMIIQVRRDVEANRAEAVGLPMQGHVYTSGEVVRS